ncbi:MAG: hypothetical protein ABF326_13015 [Arenicellales bacterium]
MIKKISAFLRVGDYIEHRIPTLLIKSHCHLALLFILKTLVTILLWNRLINHALTTVAGSHWSLEHSEPGFE